MTREFYCDKLKSSGQLSGYGYYLGDWDDPTGREIVISSYKSAYAELEHKFQKGIEWLNKKFNIVD